MDYHFYFLLYFKTVTLYFLILSDKPNPPAGSPCASKVKETSLTLSWYGPSYDGGSPVTHYKVELCEVGKDNWKTLTSKCKVRKSQNITDI